VKRGYTMRRYNIDKYLFEMSAAEAEQLFGLSGSYTAADVKKIWRKMSLQHHPDKGGSTEMMKKVNVAYDLLKRGGTVKKVSQQDKADAFWAEMNKNKEIAIKYIEKNFVSSVYLKHLEKVTGRKFEIMSEKLNNKKFSFTVGLKVRFHSVEGFDVFDLTLTIQPPSGPTKQLSKQGQEEYTVIFSGDAMLDGKDYRLYYNNRGYKSISSLDISNPEIVFPKAKIKRHMKVTSKKPLKKRDIETYFNTAKRAGKTTFGDYIINLKDDERYIIVTRQVFMRKASYSLGLYKKKGKFNYDPINSYIALVPEGPNAFLDMLEELGETKSTDVYKVLNKYANKIEGMTVRK